MRPIILILFVFLVIASWVSVDWQPYLENPELIREAVRGYYLWAPLVFFLVATAAEAVLSPGAPFTVAGGLLFGAVYGSLISLLCSTAAAVAIFLILRYSGYDLFVHYFHDRFDMVRRYNKSLIKSGFWHVLFIRLIPIIPGNVINIGYGMSQVSFRDYFWGTVLGNLPSTIILSWLGTRIFVWSSHSILFVIIVGTVLGSLVGFFYQRYWRSSSQTV